LFNLNQEYQEAITVSKASDMDKLRLVLDDLDKPFQKSLGKE
jgi:hypothetical protein